jgi:nicotinamide riboside transporter PnuC
MSKMMVFIRWIATFSGIAGALLIASNVGVSKYSFLFFLVSGLLWGVAAYSIKDYALLLLQTVFVTIDTYGVFRWLM